MSSASVVQQLFSLGVGPGGVVLVHTAFSKVQPIEGGPAGLIESLLDALGPEGTLVMPSMSDDDDHPFDPSTTPCLGLGIVADTFWRMPDVLRSNNPHAFAAVGSQAAAITRDHPLDVPHGLNSPVGRVYELGGQVLLLGVGHSEDTTIHLAESLAGVRYRSRKHLFIDKAGNPTRFDYEEIDHCCENFHLAGEWLDATGVQRKGKVGGADALLARSTDIVRVVRERLQENEMIFLHPFGVDEECDEARASVKDT